MSLREALLLFATKQSPTRNEVMRLLRAASQEHRPRNDMDGDI